MQITALHRNGKYRSGAKKLIGAPSYYRNDIADAYSLSGSNAKTYHHLHVRLQPALKPHLSPLYF